MRGRAAEITDPGALDWEVVWEALKTEEPAEDPNTLAQELGLDEEHEVHLPKAVGGYATEMAGTRNGRAVKLRLGVMPSMVRNQPVTEVLIESPVTAFSVHAEDGRLTAEPGALPEVEEVLAGLAPSPAVWRDVEVEGGPDGIRARRPIKAKGHPQGYVYDLWLSERLADRLGA
jgi:hypothetical protein